MRAAGSAEYHRPGRQFLVRPCGGGRSGGVGAKHREIAVTVDGQYLSLGCAAVGETELCRSVSQVVGVGEHLPVGDDYSCASAVTPDRDGGRPDVVGDRGDGSG